MRKSSIVPSLFQTLFDSAANAANKGQAQWFTPLEWAKVLSLPLNEFRPVIADLTCGNGQLLAGTGHQSKLLGCDIEPFKSSKLNFVAADITRFYPLLHAVHWQCDTFVLNPPWDLHWYRQPLAKLGESDCFAVSESFAVHDGRTSHDTIDSTVATLCMALDRSSPFAEGFLIGNEASLQRLILGKNAPHGALARYVWAHVSIEGNICANQSSPDFRTGIIWFARGHSRGPLEDELLAGSESLLERATQTCLRLKKNRLKLRSGPHATDYLNTESAEELWQAASEEYLRIKGKSEAPTCNIWFDPVAGVIRTYLNTFDKVSGRVTKSAAAALHALNGRKPIQLVVQRSQRQALLDAIEGTAWRVDPALKVQVEAALAEYNRVRAPLYPLPKIQRLGYLDEQDSIECCRSLATFIKGKKYPIRSATVAVHRMGTKVNNIGSLDAVEWNGQELAFFITDDLGVERLFMEGRNRDANVTVNLIRPGATGRKERDIDPQTQVIDFTLHELVDHFVIPDVPDVATLNPGQFEANLRTLEAIAKVTGGFTFKRFQREDYARAALHNGIILGHDTGLGKTIAMFVWPLLKCGYLTEGGLRPTKPILLVVPGDGHDQTEDEAFKHFKIKAGIVRLDSQQTIYRAARPDPRTGQYSLPPAYYLTSYTQLTGNGVADFPELNRANPQLTMAELNLRDSDATAWWQNRGELYGRHYQRLAEDSGCAITPESSLHEFERAYETIRHTANQVVVDRAYESLCCLRMVTPATGTRWEDLNDRQKQFVRSELTIAKHREFSTGIGQIETKAGHAIKCVYSPSLADLCQYCFAACVIDEGTKIKGDDTIIGLGVRQIAADFRLVLTATPIKNRFPDLFHLAHYVCGGHDEPSARFPYAKLDKQSFAEEFLVSERNLTKEEDSNRRFKKFTPQVCNVHRAWKLLAPVILRRRKDDCGEDIVPKIRHVVRVPMGLSQASVYQYHLNAAYKDINGKPAIGAKLQALRIAAANPASELLVRPERDATPGNPRSRYSYTPKVASVLELVRQVMERREQVIIGSAFQNGLDVFSARLNEAGVKHLMLDGRISQKRRGELARLFKQGCPRAVDEGLISRASDYPVLLAGQECMAELHSFNLCNNVILTAYSWAFDKFEQFINRAHRLNSPWPVNVWSVICEGSIDRKLEAGIHEKKDAADLVLDGHLLGEHPSEVNLAELLNIAEREFKEVKIIEERTLEQGWYRLRIALHQTFEVWKADTHVQVPLRPIMTHDFIPSWRKLFIFANKHCRH